MLLLQAGKPKLALKAFKKATEVDPENAGYWANLGRAQVRRKGR